MGKYIEQGKINKSTNIDITKKTGLGNIIEYRNRREQLSHSPRTVRSFLANESSDNFLLSMLSDEILTSIFPFLERVNLFAGDSICQPGDLISNIYFPETAIISEFQILQDGRTVEIAMTGREGVVGLLAVYSTYPAVNWTQVSVSGTAFKIKNHFLRPEILQNPSFQKMLLKFIGNYVKQVSQRAVCNSYHTLEERFCSWLLMISIRHKNTQITLTQEQIAKFLGAHRPSVTHIAQSLRTKKIIEYFRGKMLILNKSALENISCDCYSEIDLNFDYRPLKTDIIK